jgi:integrase
MVGGRRRNPRARQGADVKIGPAARNSFSRMPGSWFGIAGSRRIRGWQGVRPVCQIGVHRDQHLVLDLAALIRGFRVPLSARAAEIIREMKAGGMGEFVFLGQEAGKPLSNMALLTLLKRLNSTRADKWLDATTGKPITAHGFRATFKTWAEEAATFPHAVVETALGHTVGNAVERAYRRTDLVEQRRGLMESLARHCEPREAGDAQIIELRRA